MGFVLGGRSGWMIWMIIVWIHLVAAMFWIGGMLFFVAAVIPSVRGLSPDLKKELIIRIGGRFRKGGWISLALLFATGLLNLYHRESAPLLYGSALWIKLILILVMVALTLLHDLVLGPRSIRVGLSLGEPRPLQQTTRWLARLNLLVGLLVVLAAVYVARGY